MLSKIVSIRFAKFDTFLIAEQPHSFTKAKTQKMPQNRCTHHLNTKLYLAANFITSFYHLDSYYEQTHNTICHTEA